MFCKKCGTDIPNSAGYCPKCGEKVQREMTGSSKKPVIVGIIAGIVVICIGIGCKNHFHESKQASQKVEISSDAYTEAETKEENYAEAIIGNWKCEKGEVTFTENGNMMFGKNGVALGGGWLKYEVVDDSTLYLTGGDMPVGINMKYQVDGNYISLELDGETIIFSKD